MKKYIFLIYVLSFTLLAQTFETNLAGLNQRVQLLQQEERELQTSYNARVQQDQVLYQQYSQQRTIFDQKYNQYRQGLISQYEYSQYLERNNSAVAALEANRRELDSLKDRLADVKKRKDQAKQLAENYETEYRLQQLTIPDTNISRPFRGGRGTSSMNINISEPACDALRIARTNFPSMDDPNYLVRRNRINELQNLCAVSITKDGLDVVGFTLTNDMPNSTNPRGRGEYNSSKRDWKFVFNDRSIQNTMIEILDDSALTGRMSHDYLHTTILFIPRVNLPAIVTDTDQISCDRRVLLPTGEFVIFDAITNQITGGVLSEEAIDYTESRHQRRFAGINYHGRGIMIRTDRRSGIPQMEYTQAFNQNEDIRNALITYQGRECKVPKSLLWTNTSNHDETPVFKFATDQEFLDIIINPRCGWNLTMDDIT